MSNKIPTAHEMRVRSNEIKVDNIPLEELPLYKESLRRLQGRSGFLARCTDAYFPCLPFAHNIYFFFRS